jgi:heme/copper-type cytochrome/quinol oxidase subunit 4
MTQDLLTCPFCNAQFSRPGLAHETTRVTCPRCDETFPWRASGSATDEAISAQALAPPSRGRSATDEAISAEPLVLPSRVSQSPPEVNLGQRLPTHWIVQVFVLSVMLAVVSLALKLAFADSNTTQRALPFMLVMAGVGMVASLWLWFFQTSRSNGAIACFVLGNMVSVALLVLPFALERTAFRRGNDPKKPPGEPAPPSARQRRGVVVPAVAPAQLAGMGYLPENCNVVAGIHVAELYQQPIGAKLFQTRQGDAADGEPPPPWLIDQGLGRVELWTGLKPAAIDHVVLGLRVVEILPKVFLPHITLVARTRQAYDPQSIKAAQDALAAALGTKVVPIKHLERDYYRFKDKPSNGLPAGNGILWLADDRTLILVYRLDALDERDRLALTERQRQGAQGPAPALRKVIAERLGKGTLLWWCAVDIDQPQVVASMFPQAAKDKELAKLLLNVQSLTGGLRLQEDAAALANLECSDAATATRLAELLRLQPMPGLGKAVVSAPADDRWVVLELGGSPEAVMRWLRFVRLIPVPRK